MTVIRKSTLSLCPCVFYYRDKWARIGKAFFISYDANNDMMVILKNTSRRLFIPRYLMESILQWDTAEITKDFADFQKLCDKRPAIRKYIKENPSGITIQTFESECKKL